MTDRIGHNGGPPLAPDLLTPAAAYLLLMQAIEQAGSQAAYARKVRISATFLNDALNARKDIPQAVLNDLGLVRVTRYRRKEAENHG